MKTPPGLLFAALLFWGWQSDQLLAGALTGAALEASRVIRWRWDLADVDFGRLWTLCVLAVLATAGIIFTSHEQAGGFGSAFEAGGLRKAYDSSTATTTSVLRWLPLIFFPFLAAQAYNARSSIPLAAISLVLRRRQRRGGPAAAAPYHDISYAYFMICLFAAGIHANHGSHSYFWGQAGLILWALWAASPRRRGHRWWPAALAALLVVALGFVGEVGLGRVAQIIQDFNAQWFAKFFQANTDPSQSFTALGQIGQLKLSPRIVVRLQPAAAGVVPNYLREASYRSYQPANQSWRAGPGGRDYFNVYPEPDNMTWLLISNKLWANSVTISCYLHGRSHDGDPQGVLPLPSGCCQLGHLPALTSIIALETNLNGVALATGSGLLRFDARYGPGATFDGLPDVSANEVNDLTVPATEAPALDQVIAEMQLNATNASDAEKRLAVQAFFAHKFTYTTWLAAPRRGNQTNSPLTRFLLSRRSGHCEFFATATVLLLRELGIPARYALGYAVHEASGSGYVVRERDAHAWCLVWNRESRIWEDLDTTPGSWVAIEGRNASFLDHLSDLRSWLVYQFERFRWRQTELRKYVLWTILPLMVVLLYYLFFRRGAGRRGRARPAGPAAPVRWPGWDSAFFRVERALADGGVPRQPQESLTDWLERALREPALAELRPPLQTLLQLHYRYRFDPAGLTAAEQAALEQQVESLLRALAKRGGRR